MFDASWRLPVLATLAADALAPGSLTNEFLNEPALQPHHARRLGHRHVGLVRRRLGRRVGGLGIVARAQVLEGLVALLGAELAAQRVEELRVVDLLASALAEELRLDRVQRIDVRSG